MTYEDLQTRMIGNAYADKATVFVHQVRYGEQDTWHVGIAIEGDVEHGGHAWALLIPEQALLLAGSLTRAAHLVLGAGEDLA